MHSMLNQFYQYMSKKLIRFFESEQLSGGERFYLQFDNKDNVKDFYQTLGHNGIAEPFNYKHEQGSPYQTFCLKMGNVKVVVAATIDDVTPDYLVTLRNQVSEQENEWKETALLSICYETLDSIRGGSSDLQKEGMPFNILSITKYIKEELDTNVQLCEPEKEVIRFHLDKKLEDVVIQTSLWDYADVISLIEKGKIETEDFKSLRLFIDKELNKNSNMKPVDIRSRLDENFWLFENVQRIHDYGTQETELEKLFDDKMQPKLKKDKWFENDFSPVKNSYDNNKGNSLQYYAVNTKKGNKHLEFWEKAYQETKAGQRKRHIIIFNSDESESINMVFEFDDYLKNQFIHKKSTSYAEVSGKKLKITLPPASNEAKFYQINYKHKDESKSGYEFNFLLVPFSAKQFEGIESNYHLIVNGPDSRVVLKYEGDKISFGSFEEGRHQVLEEGYQTVIMPDKHKLTVELNYTAWEDNSLFFSIKYFQMYIPVEIKDTDSKSSRIGARQLWKLKRENKENFIFEDEKLRQGTSIYYPLERFKELLYLEKEWIENSYRYVVDGQHIDTITLPIEITECYDEYLNYFKQNKTLPSLSYMNTELQELATKLVLAVDKVIREIKEDILLNNDQKGIFKLGMLVLNEKIWMTPFHPLNIAYQLAIEKEVMDEIVDRSILERLHPKNLLPYIYSDKGELFRPTMEFEYPEWHEYENEKIVSVGTANEFLAKVVEEKIKQYIHHFNYLFLESSRSPLLLNVIHIHNDKEVVKGICQYLKKQLEQKGPKGMIPIEVVLYRSVETQSAFEIFSTLQTAVEIEEYFNLDLKSKNFDQVDVLRFIREHITYYKGHSTQAKEFQYAHISFFKLPTQDLNASHPMDKMESGLSLNGLLSSVIAISSENDYRSGFGLLHSPNEETSLVSIASSYNELAYNMQNEGKNSYSKNKSIVKSTSTEGKHLLEKIYKSSSWVTFIDPGVDLDFFQNSSPNLLVIHYNDQHTSSDRYDAITVTEKNAEYKRVIANYLNENNFTISDSDIDLAIKAFNSINGEWLLSIVGSKGHFAREKISIVSAMKYLESYLSHTNIRWIPISLEEILRVASAVNLTKSDGIFSTKNLKSSGKHSDDILMIGIEEIKEQLFIHFYPVEVKIGGLQSSKASVQIEKTTGLFYEHLIEAGNESPFTRKFYRNFFAQILLANAKKLYANRLWTEEVYQQVHNLKARLLNDEFFVGQHLNSFIGKGAVLTFRKDYPFRKAERKDDIINLTLLETDAFAGLTQSTLEITEKMQNEYLDIDPGTLLNTLYQPDEVDVTSYQSVYGGRYEPDVADETGEIEVVQEVDLANEETKENEVIDGVAYNDVLDEVEEQAEKYINGHTEMNVENQSMNSEVALLVGHDIGTNQPIYWDHRRNISNPLANHNIIITGDPGKGKTQTTKGLIHEIRANHIPLLAFDFKDDYIDEDFLITEKMEKFDIMIDGLPFNPLIPYVDPDQGYFLAINQIIQIEGILKRIYNLGPQQSTQLRTAIMEAYKRKGIEPHLPTFPDKVDEYPTFMDVHNILLEDDKKHGTLLGRMDLLFQLNLFRKETKLSFEELMSGSYTLRLSQLPMNEIKAAIAEIIILAIHNYLLSQEQPRKLTRAVVLDEAHRVSQSNALLELMREGRSFGIGMMIATQFPTDIAQGIYGCTETKLFLSNDQFIHAEAAAKQIEGGSTRQEINELAENIRNMKQFRAVLRNSQYPKVFLDVMPYYKRD
jgi:DNA phosphorothioation-dependent restriction protein DptH